MPALAKLTAGLLRLRGARIPTLCIILVALCALPALPGPQSQNTGFNLEGKITAASTGKLTVSAQDNIIFHVSYDAKTSIRRKDHSAGSPADLKTGLAIKVAGDLSPAGVIQAHLIQLDN